MNSLEMTLMRIQQIQQRFESNTNAQPSASSDNTSFASVLNQAQAIPTGEKNPLKSELDAIIQRQASEQGVDPSLVKAVVQAESGYNPRAVSPVGAQGLMQLMPSTASSMGVTDQFNPQENVKGGVRYLKGLLNKYQSVPMAVAAYNAGPGAVNKYGGIPPYKETEQYVKRVMNLQQHYSQAQGVEE